MIVMIIIFLSPQFKNIWSFIYSLPLFTIYGYCYKLSTKPAPRWLNSSVGRALHWYRRGHGLESCTGLNFFSLQFHNCFSCVYNCNNHSRLYNHYYSCTGMFLQNGVPSITSNLIFCPCKPSSFTNPSLDQDKK